MTDRQSPLCGRITHNHTVIHYTPLLIKSFQAIICCCWIQTTYKQLPLLLLGASLQQTKQQIQEVKNMQQNNQQVKNNEHYTITMNNFMSVEHFWLLHTYAQCFRPVDGKMYVEITTSTNRLCICQ